jgi:hypothetical protein
MTADFSLPQRSAKAAEILTANHANHTKAGKGLAADAGEEQRVRLGGHDGLQSWINLHGPFSQPSSLNPQLPPGCAGTMR